jgi:CheY-like chemotaxis protein
MGSAILVVDDDDHVREVVTAFLEHEGYLVLAAASAQQALDLLATNPGVRLLFTDIAMPGAMDGFALAHEAKRRRPQLRVIYTSGYVKSLPVTAHRPGHGPFVQKPWRPDHLKAILRSMLGGGPPCRPPVG